MKNLESLNQMFQRVNQLYVEQRNLLTEYLNESLQFAGGCIEMTGYYKDYDEAADNDVEFEEQFPACVTVFDKHCFHHEILVTKLYKHGNLFYVDGYDRTEGSWTDFWFTDDLNDTLDSLARFVNKVFNPETDTADTEKEEVETEDSVLIGWQIVDEEQNYPSEFGCWDVFRTKEDAEAYIVDNLDPSEYHAVEEWSKESNKKLFYTFYEKTERTFHKGERVWLKTVGRGCYAEIRETITSQWQNDYIKVKEMDAVIGPKDTLAKAAQIFQTDSEKKCPLCGNPLFFQHPDAASQKYYCPECNKNFE